MTHPLLDVSIRHKDWTRQIRDIQNTIVSIVGVTLDRADVNAKKKELSIVLADDDFVQELNREWRGKDKPTNVLSFPQDDPMMLGDVILAFETVQREADEQDKRFEDHTTHLVVHGLLHLLGHDHEEDDEAEIMESLEIEILKGLGIKNPYETQDFVP